MRPDFSIIIPIFCEEENLAELSARLIQTMEGLGRPFEIIFVNDSSRDRSLEILREMHRRDPRIKVVSFSRNFGHQIAITAGMQYARGDSAILMDGDLQDPPEVLPDLIRTKEEGGWDIVYAIRRKRKEPFLIRSLYYAYYRILRQTSTIHIPFDTGDFCVMSHRVLDQLNRMPERNRFVRGLRSWVGFRQTGMEYERAARNAGEPKYTFKSLFKLAFDGIFSFSELPLRLSTYLGLALSIAGMIYAIVVLIRRLLGDYEQLGGWPSVVVSILVLGGVQLIMLGIMGEYLGRIYEEMKARPQYIVDETLGFDDQPPKS